MAGAVQTVVEQLNNDYNNVCQAASEAIPNLAVIGQSATFSFIYISHASKVEDEQIANIMKTIDALLGDTDWHKRQIALNTVAGVGQSVNYPFTCAPNAPQAKCLPQPPRTVERVVTLLRDDDRDVRQAALDAIHQLAKAPQEDCRKAIVKAVGTIVGLLTDDDRHLRRIALEVIRKLVGVSKLVRSLVISTSNAPQENCQKAIAEASGTIVSLLMTDDSRLRQTALEVIPKLVTVGQSVNYPFMCISHSPQVRHPSQISQAVPSLVGLLQDKTHDVRQAALD